MQDIIRQIVTESIEVKEKYILNNLALIETAANRIATCISAGHKVLLFGNGGSAADAQHLTAEFINRFQIERPPLPALALTTDTSIITSIGNDYQFDDIFLKQVKALGQRGDIAWGISTSGNSPNVVSALAAAKEMNLFTIGMTGDKGPNHPNRVKEIADLNFTVSSQVTARIQETHITLGHIICDLVDRILFPESFI